MNNETKTNTCPCGFRHEVLQANIDRLLAAGCDESYGQIVTMRAHLSGTTSQCIGYVRMHARVSGMTRSTFYVDGYRDAVAGLPMSPPDVSVYASEYKSGYAVGSWSRDVQLSVSRPEVAA